MSTLEQGGGGRDIQITREQGIDVNVNPGTGGGQRYSDNMRTSDK